MPQKPFSLDFEPGVQRDGTQLDGDSYLDALWCRFRLGRPRKMGGFKQIVNSISGIPRRIHIFYQAGNNIVHIGHTKGLLQVVIDNNGNFISSADRTPTTFTGGVDVGWTFDAIFDGTSSVVQLLAHAVPDVEALSSTVQTLPFLGQIDSTGRLGAFGAPADLFGGNYTPPNIASGIFCSQPYVWGMDINGNVIWSAPNQPLTLGLAQGTSGAGTARISAQKIIAGIALRGGGAQSPAALFWSLSEVISAAFIGGTAIWAFNTVSPSSSILSSDCVVEYDGLYFWAGIDRFQVFNGTVSEVPNKQNQDWFFDNMNWDFSAKTFAFKVPRYGEIWFCAPLFNNTEPSHAVIYNVRENCWYDTVLPNGGRSAAYYAQGLRFPLMGGSVAGANGYSLWLHESGVDQVVGSQTTAIQSYFQTPLFGGPKNTPADDRGLATHQFEPDFIQTGDLTVSVIGQANVRAPQSTGDEVPIKFIPNVPQEQFASFTKENHRLTSLVIQSNQIGGNYISGKSILHAEPTEPRLNS